MAPNSTPKKAKKANPRKPWRRPFLAALSAMGCVTYAARAAKVDKRRVYKLRESDSGFAAQWDAALEEATELLEAEAMRRARYGWKEPVFYLGKPVGSVQRYSDTLLIFLLKGAKPEKYRERFDVKGGALPDASTAIAAALDQVRGARKELPPVEILPSEEGEEA